MMWTVHMGFRFMFVSPPRNRHQRVSPSQQKRHDPESNFFGDLTPWLSNSHTQHLRQNRSIPEAQVAEVWRLWWSSPITEGSCFPLSPRVLPHTLVRRILYMPSRHLKSRIRSAMACSGRVFQLDMPCPALVFRSLLYIMASNALRYSFSFPRQVQDFIPIPIRHQVSRFVSSRLIYSSIKP